MSKETKPQSFYPLDTLPPTSSHTSDLTSFLTQLTRMSASWPERAAVKKPELDFDGLYQDELPDFLISLLPFKDHPDFTMAPYDLQQRVLSCGWLAYNEKTISVETKIIAPACLHVVHGEISGLTDEVAREAMSQVFVDEAYHTLLLVNACRVTRQRRGLEFLRFPEFTLIRETRDQIAMYTEPWKKILMQLVCATVSEVSISDYLSLLSGATSIQPLNMMTTEIHRRDESAHAGIFKKISQMSYSALSRTERDFFVKNLAKPLAWFSSWELTVWQSLLTQIKFPNADQIIQDCRSASEYDLTTRDFSALSELMVSLGLDVNSDLEL